MLTAEQYAANLASARRVAAARIGWTGPTAQIPYELKEAYSTALAEIMLKSPDAFTAQSLNTARRELADRPNEALVKYGAGEAVGDFAGEVGNQAESIGQSVASVGEGAKSALKLARYLIPAALVAVVLIWLRNLSRR